MEEVKVSANAALEYHEFCQAGMAEKDGATQHSGSSDQRWVPPRRTGYG